MVSSLNLKLDWCPKVNVGDLESFKKGKKVLALKNYYANRSCFEVLGVQRLEFVYSNVLAWLLNLSVCDHLAMRLFLVAVRTAAQKFYKSNSKCVTPFWLDKIKKYKIKTIDVRRESLLAGTRRRMDVFCQMTIEIKGKDIPCQLVIENKIDSTEYDSQTEIYHKLVCEKFGGESVLFVFLTPEPTWRLMSGFAVAKCSSSAYVQMNYQILIDYMLEPLAKKIDSENSKSYIANLIMAMRYDEKKENLMAVSLEERKLLRAFIKEQKDFLKRVVVSLEYCQPDEELNLVGLAMNKHDRTKYSLDHGSGMSMNRLVLAAVKKYVKENPGCDWNMLVKAFPSQLQGTFGVVARMEDDLYINHQDDPTPRYFDDDDEIITLENGTKVVVCTQWGTGGRLGKRADNFNRFLSHIRDHLHYSVEKVLHKADKR